MQIYTTTLAIGMPGWWEMAIIGVIGLLIFGKRLPEVGRGIVEFKKGLAGVDEEVEAAAEAQRKHELAQQAGNTTNVETHAEVNAEPPA